MKHGWKWAAILLTVAAAFIAPTSAPASISPGDGGMPCNGSTVWQFYFTDDGHEWRCYPPPDSYRWVLVG